MNNNIDEILEEKEEKNISNVGDSYHKLKALIKKNMLVLKRNIGTTICEIFFPILLMIIVLLIRNSFEIDEYRYDEQVENTTEFIKQAGIANVDLPDLNLTSRKWNELSIGSTLSICANTNRKKTERPLIGSIGVPDEIKERIILDAQIYRNFTNFNVNMENFKDFKSVKDLEDYVKSEKYGTTEAPLICMGLGFEEIGNSYKYSLHYFDSIFEEGIKDVDDIINGPVDFFRFGPNMYSYYKYLSSGYTYMMKVVNDYILQKETGDSNAHINFGMMPMKYINYKNDPFGEYIGFVIPFFIVVAYMCPLCLYIYRIVSEKESGAKEGMKIMGLSEGIYFLSYFLQYLIISLFVSIINSIIIGRVYTKIPYYFIFLIFFLWALNIFALAFFFQSFIDSTRFALILSLLLYFIMYFISLACIRVTAPKSIKIGLSFFPPCALEVGIVLISEFQSHFRKFHPSYFSKTYTNYSLLLLFIQFIIDFFIYLILGFYLQNVIPHKFGIRKPFYFIFTSEYWCGKKIKKKKIENLNQKKINESSANQLTEINKSPSITSNTNSSTTFEDYYKDNPNFEGETLYRDRIKKDDVLKIKNIVKTFEDGKTAVDHVYLNFYKNEIFALLGHNGAGKTTLISMLTGLYEATEGNAFFDGDDILIGNNMDKFRNKLGICPQHDLLFEDLTIKEHLEMFSIFKGVKAAQRENEVNKYLNSFQLSEIKDVIVENLSAGKKRQLSIALALIGGSQVIFLDEPSSGMDITSRRNLWEILKRQMDQKIIILTTHYMEEASILGNRIGIINEGKMKCIGTPLFLIERFGKYLSINVYKEENARNENIINYITSRTRDTQYEILSEEILFRIPKYNYIEGGNLNLENFFNEFDLNVEKLKIKSYSVSMPTLEDVFLNIASEDNSESEKNRAIQEQKEIENDKILFETQLREDYSSNKFCCDFLASFKRRIYLILRDFKSFLMEVLCPILLVLIGLAISKSKFKWDSDPWTIDISYIGLQNVLFSAINGINSEDYFFKEKYTNVTCQNLDIGEFSQDEKYKAIEKFVDRTFETNRDTEDSELKEVDMTADDYVGYFGGLLMLTEENNTYEFFELINARIAIGVPTYTHYFLKDIIEKAAGHKVDIEFTHYPLPLTNEVKNKSDQVNYSIVVLFVATAFSLIPSSFVTMLVSERRNNSKHLMRVSGINIISYWIVNYIFELVKYYAACGVCIFFIWVFDYYKKYLFLIYALYGPAMVSCTYIFSFFFHKESSAQNGVILLNFLIGALGSITVMMFRGQKKVHKTGKALEYIFALLPSFCFDFGYDLLLNRMIVFLIDYPNDYFLLTDKDLIVEFNLLLLLIIYLIAEIIVYTILLFIAEKFTYVYVKPPDEKLENNINDSLVINEIEKANLNKIAVSNEADTLKKEYALRLKNIRKIFKKGYCCCKREIVGIKNLNFCVEESECFGLLGLNGAGKTTTFKCITQKLSPTNGTIYINGKDTSNKFKQFKSMIGYCPQYEAIFEYMTVYENLDFYARIKGVKTDLIHSLIMAMIDQMSLENYTNKVAGKLSGGNKRKLSVAISLLCTPEIILLDEPSTGMDPEARRFMWAIIHKTSKKGKKSSIIMTTHSMDEAETLCKRIGIMVNGEFVCLGKPSQIKDKYGYGYELNMKIKPLTILQQNEIIRKINEKDNSSCGNNLDLINEASFSLCVHSTSNSNSFFYDNKSKIKKNNLIEILTKLNKINLMTELKEERLGKKIIRDIEINGSISLITFLNWIFFVRKAFKFINYAQNYFDEIILSEFIENSFLFKLKKGPETKSIGFLFGLFEKYKEECFIAEYSIQQTSLEQIFNKFAQDQISMQKKKNLVDKYETKEIKSEILVDKKMFANILE